MCMPPTEASLPSGRERRLSLATPSMESRSTMRRSTRRCFCFLRNAGEKGDFLGMTISGRSSGKGVLRTAGMGAGAGVGVFAGLEDFALEEALLADPFA